jgi:hypothetical protein
MIGSALAGAAFAEPGYLGLPNNPANGFLVISNNSMSWEESGRWIAGLPAMGNSVCRPCN